MAACLYLEGAGSARHRARHDPGRRRRIVVAAAVLMCSALVASAVHAAAPPALSAKWRITSTADDAHELALTMTLEKDWHVNANDPDRPYLIPTTLEIDPPPAGTTIAGIRYPDAVIRSLAFAPGMPLRLYEGTFTMVVRLSGRKPKRLDARLRYQACNDETCLPPRTLDVPFVDAP